MACVIVNEHKFEIIHKKAKQKFHHIMSKIKMIIMRKYRKEKSNKKASRETV